MPLSTDEETLKNAFKDIGDISGLTIFDAGSEGVASRFLAERIGDGRIIGVNIWLEAYGMVRKRVGDELMDKVVFIKDDMQHIDYLKDDFFDLIVSYETLASIENKTPGGSLPILRQFHRILKHEGRFLTVESFPSTDTEPANRAQELSLVFEKIINQIRPPGKAFTLRQLLRMLKRIGFVEIRWKIVSNGIFFDSKEVTEMIDGLKNLTNERIREKKQRESILKQIEDLDSQTRKSGLQTLSYYALYAKKP